MAINVFEPPLILRLHLVSKDDFMEYKEILESEVTVGEQYDKIPSIFTNLDSYPEHTNLACWNCDRLFDTRPIFVPSSITQNDNDKIEIQVHGNFCSFNCAMSYIILNYPRSLIEYKKRLCYLYEIFNKKKVYDIQPAHSKIVQQKYGGNTTSQQYNIMMDQLKN